MKPDRESRLLKELACKPASLDFDAEDRRRKAIQALGAADSDRVFHKLLEIYARPAADTDGHKQRFYELDTGDQIAAIAFVPPRTFSRARRLRLV